MKKIASSHLVLIPLLTLICSLLLVTSSVMAAKSVVIIEKGSSSESSGKFFSPSTLKVKKGTTVVWKNEDSTLHTVTSGSPDSGDSGAEFDSSYLAADKTYEFRFEKNGRFDYYCTLHPFMTGVIQVTDLGNNEIANKVNNQPGPVSSSQDKNNFLIRMTPLADGYLYPSSNVTVIKGITVIWKNIFDKEVYIKSHADLDHYEGQVIDSGLLQPGETFSYKFNENGSFPYSGSNGIEGVITVVNNDSKIDTNVQKTNPQINASSTTTDINRVKWINFTDDRSLFSVEYPSQWTAKAGNRFSDDPPLSVENMNGSSSQAHSKFEIKIFDDENLSSLKWAQLKKKELVDNVKDTKLVEPLRCTGYIIDGVQACGFVFAGNNAIGKRVGELVLVVNDNANMTHLIRYMADPVIFDPEQPILNHMLMSYKLSKNHLTNNGLYNETLKTIQNQSMVKPPDFVTTGNPSVNLTRNPINSTKFNITETTGNRTIVNLTKNNNIIK